MKKIPRFLKIFISVIIFLGLFWTIVNLIQPYQVIEYNTWRKEDRTLITAHRGGANLNPENTKMAFDYVIRETSYTDIVEFDVRLTEDDDLVIMHDATINRTGLNVETNDIIIREHTFEELNDYNLGVNFEHDGIKPYENLKIEEATSLGLTIMRLTDFLDEYKDDRYFRVYLEIKDDGDDAKLAVDKVEGILGQAKYDMWDDRIMFISFSKTAVKHTLENYPNRYVAGMGFNIVPSLIGSKLKLNSLFKVQFQSIQISMVVKAGPLKINCATKSFVNAAHKRNQSVSFWTIDDEEDMRLLIELGVDGITTDSPDVLARVLGVI